LVGQIIARFERKGLCIGGLKLMKIGPSLARELYSVHRGKPFYEPLVRFSSCGPLVAMVVCGKAAISVSRKLLGKTFAGEAEPGTIRGDFGVSNRFNLVHGSDSPESAAREIALFFTPVELVEYEPMDLQWLYDFSEGGEPV
jgi:nucleoside-diphosphate kinase